MEHRQNNPLNKGGIGGLKNIFSKSKIFLICCIVFIIGVAIASFLSEKIARYDLWWFTFFIFCLVFLVLFRQNKIIRLAGLAGLFLFLGIWRYSLSLPANTSDKIWFYNGSEIIMRGVVVKEPDARRNFTKYTVEVGQIMPLREALPPTLSRGRSNLGKTEKMGLRRFAEAARSRVTENNISGKVLITANLYPTYNYGDKLEIKCALEAPKSFNEFAYDKYLARYDVYSVCYYPEIKIIDSNNGNFFLKKIFKFKKSLSEKISYNMNEPESGLARGIILNERADISEEINKNFSRTGLTHLIAISGMNITILAFLTMNFFIFIGLWRRQAFYLTAVFLILYIILIGAPASAVRAAIMGIIVLYALSIGRLNKPESLLAFAASLMVLFNPKILRFDVGFQLSFLAILGIMYFYSKIDEWLKEKRWIKIIFARQALSLTLAAQIFTLPILAVNFSIISLISPPANLLAVWTMPIIMVSVLIALPFGFALPQISPFIFLPAQLLLKYLVWISGFLAKIPKAYLEINLNNSLLSVVSYYGVLLLIIFRKNIIK